MSVHDKYKTFWPRFWAGAVDGLTIGFLSLVINFLLPGENIFENFRSEILIAAPTLYFTICHWKFGYSLGKKLNGIIVLDVSELSYLSFHRSLTREIAGWLEILNLLFPYLGTQFPALSLFLFWLNSMWFPLEIITMLSNPKRRALHDFLAQSVVVRSKYIDITKLKRSGYLD